MMEKLACSSSEKRVKLERNMKEKRKAGEVAAQQVETSSGSTQLIRSPKTKPYLAPEVI